MAILETPAECSVKIDNREIKYNVSGVQLRQYIDDHHELRVRIQQIGDTSGGKVFDDPDNYTKFLGKSIAVKITPTGGYVDEDRALEFIGTVTEISLDNSIDGLNTVHVTACSPTVALDGADQYVQHMDQSASDIIGALLRKYPVTLGKVESTSGTYKFDTQYGETDYDYVRRVAGSQELFAYYDGQEFRVEKANSDRVDELVWRETLGYFRLGLNTVPHEYASKVYNYEQKKTFSQDTKSLSQESSFSNISKAAPDASKEVYKDSGFSMTPKVVADAQSLDKVLKTERNRSLGGMVRCHGQSNVPRIAVGRCVQVKGMDKLDGLYWVKAVKHVFEESGKYHNTFVCSPIDISYPEKRSSSEALEISEKPALEQSKLPVKETVRPSKFAGLHVAHVVDNNDPDKLGRIKIRYPWAEADTIWVRLLTPHAGQDRGWVSLPEVGDEVLIGFEFGDPDYPIALGALYNKESSPPSDTGGDGNNVKIFMTRSGNQIYFNDTDGSEELKISMKDGKNQIVMGLSGPSISIKCDGGDVSIEGNNITIESQQEITLKAGTNLNIEAGANLKTKASAMLNIEGATTTVKGNPIQLN
jgi:Rhs element Vgr protein